MSEASIPRNETVLELREMLSQKTSIYFTDEECARFLAARAYKLYDAAEMAEKAFEWRHTELPGELFKGVTPHNILTEGENIDITKHESGSLLPFALQGEDKQGNPIYWERAGQISQKFAASKKIWSVNDLVAIHVRTMELMEVRYVHQMNKHGTIPNKATCICDYGGLTFSLDFDLIRFIQRIATIDQNFYPERLGVSLIINAPWYLQTIYAMVKPFIDPATQEKFQFHGTNYQNALFKHVVLEQIPECYGGKIKDAEFPWAGPWSESSGCSDAQVAAYVRDNPRYQDTNVVQPASQTEENSTINTSKPPA